MDTNNKHARIQQRRIRKCAKSTNSYEFFNLLTDDRLFSKVEELLPEHRERTFPPTETLSMFLAQAMHADRSCQNIVNQSAVTRISQGLPLCSTNTGAYCKARQRLPIEMVAELVRFTGNLSSGLAPEGWRWRGRPVKLVDGTTTTMPDTPENQAVYPQQSIQKDGLGFPICRIVGIICLGSGTVLNAAIGPWCGKGTGEQSLLRGLLDTFEQGDLVIGDAYYSSFFLLADLISRGVDGVFEQHGARQICTDFRKGKRLGKSDHLIIYKKPQRPKWMSEDCYRAVPESLTIRELRVGKKVLVSTLLSPHDAPKQSLKELYKDRWHVELDFRNIKTTLGMETLSCKSPEMVEKEIWIYFLAHNMIRIIMAEAASLADIVPRQLSFKHSLQLWQAWRQSRCSTSEDKDLLSLLKLMSENLVGHRPGRVEPRAVKRRPKPYPLLMKPRNQARAAIRRHGHPAKQR